MKTFKLLKLTAAAVVMSVVLGAWEERPCPAIDPPQGVILLPNPNDCESFYMCSNGVPILQKCPLGLHFNATLSTCDWPEDAGCAHVCYDMIMSFPGVSVWYCEECIELNNSVFVPLFSSKDWCPTGSN